MSLIIAGLSVHISEHADENQEKRGLWATIHEHIK